MKPPFFSIIVPVYNVAPYLEKCVNSILSQEEEDFEVILVDDGSTDNSSMICDYLSGKNSKIHTIHKKNGGSSSARNAGLDIAIGEYVLFVDGDDYWCTTSLLSSLRHRIEGHQEDLILYRCKKQLEDGSYVLPRSEYDLTLINSRDKESTIQYLAKTNNVPGAAWIICTKSSLLRISGLRFREGITAEDYDWCLKLLYFAHSIGAINSVDYVYVSRPNSITTSAKPSGILGISFAINEWLSLPNRPNSLDNYLAKVYLLSLMSYSKLKKEDREKLTPLMKKDNRILKIGGMSLLHSIVSIIGPKNAGWCLKRLYYLRSNLKNCHHA